MENVILYNLGKLGIFPATENNILLLDEPYSIDKDYLRVEPDYKFNDLWTIIPSDCVEKKEGDNGSSWKFHSLTPYITKGLFNKKKLNIGNHKLETGQEVVVARLITGISFSKNSKDYKKILHRPQGNWPIIESIKIIEYDEYISKLETLDKIRQSERKYRKSNLEDIMEIKPRPTIKLFE